MQDHEDVHQKEFPVPGLVAEDAHAIRCAEGGDQCRPEQGALRNAPSSFPRSDLIVAVEEHYRKVEDNQDQHDHEYQIERHPGGEGNDGNYAFANLRCYFMPMISDGALPRLRSSLIIRIGRST